MRSVKMLHASRCVFIRRTRPARVLFVGPTVRPAYHSTLWFTVNVRPAIVNVPVLDARLRLIATRNVMTALPVPLLSPRIVIQSALLVAFHLQPPLVMTLTVPVPPSKAAECVAGEIW